MTHKEALQNLLKWSAHLPQLANEDIIAATEALKEPTEPRMYSEEEVINIVDKWVRYQEEVGDGKSISLKEFIQSLSPKEGKEKVRTYTYRELECFGIYLMSGDYIHTITNNKELVEHCKKQAQAFTGLADYESLEPNQTEAPKETIEALAEKVLEKYFPNPDDLVNGRVKSVIVKAMEEYASLARKQVIEEIEEWVKKEWFGAKEDDMTYYENVVNADELLTKLQTLKP